MKIISHRGYHKFDDEITENTIAAFNAAVEQGATLIELDVHLTTDEQWVVYHDAKLADGSLLADMSSDRIKSKSEELSIPINFLDEVFSQIAGIHINVECKPKNYDIGKTLAEDLTAWGVQERCNISSFSRKSLRGARSASDDIRLSYLDLGFLTKSWKLLHEEIDLYSINPFYSFTRKRLVTQAHKLGTEVHVWTVNKEKVMRRMIKRNVDAIITDVLPLGLNLLV